MRAVLSLSALIGMLALAGCQQQPAATKPAAQATPSDVPVANGRDSSATTAAGGDGQRGLRIRPDVEAFPGRWGLVAPQPVQDRQQQFQFRDICLALFEFTAGPDSALQVKVLATPNDRVKIQVDRVAVEGKKIELDLTGTFDGNPGRMEFRGTLSGGVVRGSVTEQGTPPFAAYLKPTDETSFDGWDSTPIAPGMDIFLQATQQKNQPAAMLAAAKELHGNPLSLIAYQGILQMLPQMPRMDEVQLREIIADYVAAAEVWGPRKELEARLNGAAVATSTHQFPAFALELIQQIEDSQAEGLEGWTDLVRNMRTQSEVDLAFGQMRSTDETARAAGFAALQERLPSQRFNSEILHVLAEYALKIGNSDLAQGYLADIVAMPLLEAMWHESRAGQPPGDPTPREQLVKLWEEKHGSLDGFDAFLDQTYHDRLAELIEQTKSDAPEPTPADAGNHTVLVELFTGTGCGPCVAGDVALSVLRDTYPASEVVALQFHQHIPLPDPLCNQDSEDRFGYYAAQGTPSVFIDGAAAPPPGVGGFLQHVKRAYSAVRPLVDERAKISSDVAIAATADVTDGQLSVDATVDGVPEDQLTNVRLRLALAENEIAHTARNGIRSHELVVREMLGGAKGVGAKSGKLAYTLQMPLAELKEHLVEYLKTFEAGRDVTFPDKPLSLKPLSLVVWVQNDQTREVLQAVLVPVTGELVYPADEPAAESPSAATPANTPPK